MVMRTPKTLGQSAVKSFHVPIINIFALQTIREEKGLSWTVGACHLQRLLTLASVMYQLNSGTIEFKLKTEIKQVNVK
jgi:hypothetical protein